MDTMTSEAFENVKNQMGRCGIWCGSCAVGNGSLRELTRKYREMIGAYGLREWAPRDFDFEEFSKGLVAIEGIPACSGCLKGGGRDNCGIRACALSKRVEDCTDCEDLTACRHTEILEKMRSGARAAGMMVKAESEDGGEVMAKWAAGLRSRWPSCILFLGGLSGETR
jgi:hypothetical protein